MLPVDISKPCEGVTFVLRRRSHIESSEAKLGIRVGMGGSGGRGGREEGGAHDY